MDEVTLPPDLQEFAAQAIEAGRFRNTSEVVQAGVRLLRQHEQARAELVASVLAAEEQVKRDGGLTAQEVAAHVRQLIARKASAVT